MGALDALIYGVRDLFADTVQMARRARLSFGPDFTLEDDAVNEWTRVGVRPNQIQGNAAGHLVNTADVVKWSPASTSSVRGITVVGTTATVDATPTDVGLELGDPAVEIDDDDFVVQASAIVSVRRPADGEAETFRISCSFSRDAGGAVAAIEASSDDGSSPATPTLTVPSITWDTVTKMPKITVTGDAGPDSLFWRAVLSCVVFTDPG